MHCRRIVSSFSSIRRGKHANVCFDFANQTARATSPRSGSVCQRQPTVAHQNSAPAGLFAFARPKAHQRPHYLTTSQVRSSSTFSISKKCCLYFHCSIHRIEVLNSCPSRCLSSTVKNNAMDLKTVVSRLDEFAPTTLAGSWDNVGLLVEPTPPHQVAIMCLTNDLTEEVLAEAINKKVNFILSYHPPIFVPLKRLTMRNVKERIVVRALENRIAVYSPHTCYDTVEGGVTDWLVEGLGDVKQSESLDANYEQRTPSGDDVKITFMSSESAVNLLRRDLPEETNSVCSIPTENDNFQISCTCRKSCLARVLSSISGMNTVQEKSVQITELAKAPMLKAGAGRIATLTDPTLTSTVVERIKTHLALDHVQIAMGQGKTLDSLISTVAICAGSGASVLKHCKADMFLTGEMSHHDILAAVAEGTTVVVCNHSNTERGFLHVLQKKFTKMFESQINVFVSETDRDPLQFI